MRRFAKGLLPGNGRALAGASKFGIHVGDFQTLRNKLGVEPSGGADLSKYLPEVLDQNLVGSCVMNGVPVAAYTTLAYKGTPLPFVPSVKTGYQLALRLDRAYDNPGKPVEKMPALVDVGTQLLTGAVVLGRYGVQAMGPRVIVQGEERNSDCDPKGAVDPDGIDFEDIEESSTRLIVGAYELVPSSPTFERDAMLALDAGHTVALGNWVSSSFELYGANSAPIGEQDFFDPYGGGHCTFLHKYIRDATSTTIWDGTNSWGTKWGRKGRYQCKTSFLKQAWSAFVMDVKVVSS